MVTRFRHRLGAALAALGVGLAVALPAHADSGADCFSDDNERRIEGCSALIMTPGISADEMSSAFAMRALAYSLKGLYDQALADYDKAIRLNPNSAVALNNRAWAYFKAGRGPTGLPDVERSLALQPTSPHAYDTRAHIRQSMGNLGGAFADYETAMRYGGERMVKLYQCGLQARGYYEGNIDGLYTDTVRDGLKRCLEDKECDPLPADEECRAATS